MCEPYRGSSYANTATSADREADAVDAGKRLARLMERQLGYVEGHIDNIALRLFIQAHWTKVAAFAHIIHGAV